VTDIRFADMRELAQVKRDVVRNAMAAAQARQPGMDNSRFIDQQDLAQVKRDVSRQAMQRSGGR
jgi:hypothetical protein